MAESSLDRAGEETCLRLVLDIWHPDCWTLEVTERTEGSLLGHGVYDVDRLAIGRFTAFGDTTAAVSELVDGIEASPLTSSVRVVPDRRPSPVWEQGNLAPGNASCGLLVTYEPTRSIASPLVSRGLIPDAPVRIRDGRERWAVLSDELRETVFNRLEEVREEADAAVEVVRITAPDAGPTPLFPEDPLSDRQREVFELARGRGYYGWPRGVSAAELACELDVSKATVLEHLRKAEAKLLDSG
ncbi:helix-turn-helix domain-containing protein [Halorarum salinum]|uniref:Helix-turn-helix domain-containing protein n=1 Tax=Halorarum salinum TaxID=2743089 RepID=A0A7D5QMD0_9EURY|nr:helix-turn-helix domain-containing protein [Halobaculum salinum]QLG63405.1 helix-turn-helix domain-containing protein [Halobaculum salinum]